MRNTAASLGDDDRVGQRAWTPEAVEDLLHGLPGHDPDLTQLVQTLRAGRRTPPVTGALAEVLTGERALSELSGYETPGGQRSRRRTQPRRAAVLAAVLAAVGPVLTGTAAVNALPAPAQRAAASVLNVLTPFTFPLPTQDVRPTRPPAPDRSVPVPAATPTTDQAPLADEPTPAEEDVTRSARDQGAAPATGGGSGDAGQPAGPTQSQDAADDGGQPAGGLHDSRPARAPASSGDAPEQAGREADDGRPARAPASSGDAPEQAGREADDGTTPSGTSGRSAPPGDDTPKPGPDVG